MKKNILIYVLVMLSLIGLVKLFFNKKTTEPKTHKVKVERKNISQSSQKTTEMKYIMMAHSELNKQNFQSAMLNCEKAIAENHKNTRGYHCRADVYLKMGNKQAALSDYYKALEINPNDKLAQAKIKSLR